MRIVGYIEHPQLKITVFKMDGRLSAKFETAQYEQTYKWRDGEGVENLADAQRVVDEEFLAAVLENMAAMHRVKMRAVGKNFSSPEGAEFEKIL